MTNSNKKHIYWLASYPKSGNTWMRTLLSNYFSDSNEAVSINNLSTGHIASSRVLFDDISPIGSSDLSEEEIDNLRPDIYIDLSNNLSKTSFHKVHDAYTLNSKNHPIFPAEASAGVIYLIRNPLDVVVSYSNHSNSTIEKTIIQLNNKNHKLSGNKNRLQNQVRQKIFSWSDHVKSWTEQKEIPVLVISYEEMIKDVKSAFIKVLEFSNQQINEDKIKIAIENSKFENLSKQELEDGFSEKPPKVKAFFKSGKVGVWKKILTEKQILEITEHNKEIMNKFGY